MTSNSHKYHYSRLADTKEEEGGDNSYNLYAVIIDATLPYKTLNKDKFICSLKVMDPTLYIKEDDSDQEAKNFASIVLYAKRLEDLPVISRVGDIIRIHWANMKIYRGVK